MQHCSKHCMSQSTGNILSTIVPLLSHQHYEMVHIKKQFILRRIATYGLSGLKMNILSGITELTGFVSSASSFSSLHSSGSLLLTAENKEKKMQVYHSLPTRMALASERQPKNCRFSFLWGFVIRKIQWEAMKSSSSKLWTVGPGLL